MRKRIVFPLVFLAILSPRSTLGQTGDEILKIVEDTINAPGDRVAYQRITLIDRKGNKKVREVRTYQKGSEKLLIRFLSPADVKGVSFLVLSKNRMYLYMPAFRKVRRIASHIKNENFMGTDFSYEDLAEAKFTEDYTARLVREESDRYILEIVPRPDADVGYSREILVVEKKSYIPIRSELYGKDGKLMKVMRMEGVKKVEGYWMPTKIIMETVKTGHQTVVELLDIRHDTGLSDAVFTKRNLKRME